MLHRHLGSEDRQQTLWQELNEGTATIVGFATLCTLALSGTAGPAEELCPEAMAILVTAVNRGSIEIRVNKESFDSSERLLGVCVEVSEGEFLLFRKKSEPEQTIRFLNGFRQLCLAGFAMHHIHREFSLTAKGFEEARKLNPDPLKEYLAFATEVTH